MQNNELWSLDGDAFTLRDPTPRASLKQYLSNGDYGLTLDQLGNGYSVTLGGTSAGERAYVTHHGHSIAPKGRFLYCLDRESGALWNPSFGPTRNRLDSYECAYAPGSATFVGDRDGMRVTSDHFLPRSGRYEIWVIRAENRSLAPRSVSLVAQAEFLLQSNGTVDYPYYSWYVDSDYDAGSSALRFRSRKPGESPLTGFLISLDPPTGYQASLRAFLGDGTAARPDGCLADACAGLPNGGDVPAAAFRYDLRLGPGVSWETALFIGEGEAAASCVPVLYGSMEDVARERGAYRSAVMRSIRGSRMAGTQEAAFSPQNGGLPRDGSGSSGLTAVEHAWFDSFLPYQIREQSLGMVRFAYRGYRDVAQDAMGLCQYDLESAARLILDLARMQRTGGRCLRQACMTGGPHDERDFRDLPFWLPLALERYVRLGGSPGILDERVPYLEGGESYPLIDHVARGLRYALRLGRHNLIEMGAGDWNDALSAFGSSGESLWLNQIAYRSLDAFARLSGLGRAESAIADARAYTVPEGASRADPFAEGIEPLRSRLFDATVEGWSGEWFLRGYTDSGAIVGGVNRLFLLPQAWFTLSGMGAREPTLAAKALDSMVSLLDHPDGFLKCHPPFTAFDPEIGNLSALTPGIAENFAVYNHASAFAVSALFLADRREEALRYLRRVIPLGKDLEKTLTEPYAVVNYYNGGFYPHLAGRGGISWLTGTANWLAMIDSDYLRA